MVKFGKNASDATSTAIRLARAATGRDLVVLCHDQPYFSAQDWFVGTLPINTGVPDAVRSLMKSFGYNDLESLRAVLEQHEGQVACVMLEAASALAEPAPGFLEGVRELCDRHGVVLVFDETITGFRWAAGGAQSVYGVTPDLSTWGKAMGNGFPIAAIAGRRELMELGGLNTDRPRVFLLSSTHGAETVSLAAFRAVVRGLRRDRSDRDHGAPGRRAGRRGQRGRGRGGHRRRAVGDRPPVLPDLPHRRRQRRAEPGHAHAVPAGDPAPRRARPVLRDLGRAHRRRRRADRRGRPRGHRRPTGRPWRPAARRTCSRAARSRPAHRLLAAPRRLPV